ncbi:SPASM domain-containing protein [Curvivirga sp.]|uniref:SPASM domain-containing protein n=1 Tax=Curvivirga sp. TaxID=2856848 RepID=UPI003B596BF9
MVKINANLDLSICNAFKIGEIKDKSIKDVWNNVTAMTVREGLFLNPENCDTCHFKFCVAGDKAIDTNNSAFEPGSNLSQ